MSYAIRKDGQGWRAVNRIEDVTADEDYSPTPPIKTPTELAKEESNLNIQNQIKELEMQIDLKMLRDFFLRPNVPISRPSGPPKTPTQIIIDIDTKIAALQTKLQ